MDKHIVVIGGGVAGLEASGRLGRMGFRVTLLEKDENIGGHITRWYQLFPDRRNSREVTDYLASISDHKNITIMTGTEVESLAAEGGQYIVSTADAGSLRADAVVIATGFDLFDAGRKEEYGYGIYENVITAAELEAMFQKGRIVTAAGTPPKRVGIVHCVGSRDEKAGNYHCSKVCCVTAVKQAIEIREMLPETRVFCFYMDMRMFGPGYEELYRESQEKWNVNYIRGKVSEAGETIDHRLSIKVEDTLAGRPMKMEIDLLVLMTGMENSASGSRLARKSGLELGDNRFFRGRDHHFATNESDHRGIFFAGSCISPMNITDSLSHARAAALEVSDYLENKR
ncbi:MAG: FAD-dependent oxidoreductase [Bacteroidales bacterium]|jgi:heterodisulfide reductase subunit A|nr:FAD-dependent oxidoreductase [Bacteroidales bacterium]